MPDQKPVKRSIDPKELLTAAGVAGVAGTAAVAGDALRRKARERSLGEKPKPLDRQRSRLDRVRSEQRAFTEKAMKTAQHPQKRWSETQWRQNPQQFRKAAKAGRLQRAADRASKRLGVLGVVLNAPSAIMDVQKIEAEGGTRAAKFGKFVERMLGVRPFTSDRPMTDAEKRAALST